MSVRYELFGKIQQLTCLVKNSDYNYSKLIASGELENIAYDYTIGFYDVNICYVKGMNGEHYCRIVFGTLRISNFGAWAKRNTEEKAKELVELVAKEFETINNCPSVEKLNKRFEKLGVYFCFE